MLPLDGPAAVPKPKPPSRRRATRKTGDARKPRKPRARKKAPDEIQPAPVADKGEPYPIAAVEREPERRDEAEFQDAISAPLDCVEVNSDIATEAPFAGEPAEFESSPVTAVPCETETSASSRPGFWRRLCHAFRMQNTMPCVGLAVMAGCLTFVITPDESPTLESRLEAVLDPAFPTIVIDAGHGGKDDGARANGLVEKELTLDVAIRVDQLLQAAGFKTVFTRESDQYLTLAERAAMANGIENSLFVSLHFNKSTTSTATGVETFYATEKVAPEAAWTWVGYFTEPEPPADADKGEELAGFVQAALLTRTNATNRGIKARKLYVVRHTRSPAILVECGFLSNPFEARLIANSAYRDRLAAAIVEGIIQFQEGRPRVEPPTQLVKTER